MTRINCIPVQELTNLHLLAEYKEMPRIATLIWKWYDKTFDQVADIPMWVHPSIPESYRMGKGHVTFFYDKGEYLNKRFKQIVDELTKRGYNLNYTEYRIHPDGMNNDWIPTESAQNINRERILERLTPKKETYDE